MARDNDDSTGLIHIYTGDGKGKTTAAVGLSVRAKGTGKRVLFAQFMKGGVSGELTAMRELGITVLHRPASRKFVRAMNDEERRAFRRVQGEILEEVRERADGCDLLIMDEILSAVTTGMVDAESVVRFLDGKPQRLEVALTGRNPAPELLARADYVSDIQCRRHPYERGVGAREGIEF